MERAPHASRRRVVAIFWPLCLVGGIALGYGVAVILITVAHRLNPDLGSALYYFLFVFTILPVLLFGVPCLLLIQVALLVRAWRKRGGGPAPASES